MLEKNRFAEVAIQPSSDKWEACIKGDQPLYTRSDDIRSEFLPDYNRILQCNTYRKIKILSWNQLRELKTILEKVGHNTIHEISNNTLLHNFIRNLITKSSPDKDIRFNEYQLDFRQHCQHKLNNEAIYNIAMHAQ